MRVLMLSPDAQMIDRRILQEAATLAARGDRVTVLSGFECQKPDAYEEDGVVVKRFTFDWRDRRRERLSRVAGPRLTRMLWQPYRVANRLMDGPTMFDSFIMEKALEHEFDVVHVHDFPMLAVGARLAALRGARLIYDSHEFYPLQETLPESTRRRYMRIERRLARSCDAVITVNPYIARMMADAHGIRVPHVILNAAEVSPEPAENLDDPALRRAERRRLGLPEDDFLVLYQGWISGERNLEPMVEAFARVRPGCTLVVVGYGEYLAVLRRLAEQAGAADRVLFYGRVESRDLPRLTRLCDLGLIPYRAVDEMHRYCSPNKLFEFIASRIPILASDLPYLRDVIGGYGIGRLAVLDDPEGVAAAVEACRSDPEAMQGFRRNLERAAAEFNWDVEGAKLLAIYDSLARPAAAA